MRVAIVGSETSHLVGTAVEFLRQWVKERESQLIVEYIEPNNEEFAGMIADALWICEFEQEQASPVERITYGPQKRGKKGKVKKW